MWRIVEHQHKIYAYNATSTDERAEILNGLIEASKPKLQYPEWHDLIATPFRYSLPIPDGKDARFCPVGSRRTAFFGSHEIPTCLFEHAKNFFKFRLNLKKINKTGQRTLFSATLIPTADITDITNNPDIAKLTDPRDCSASHEFAARNPELKVLKYPSCRDPERRANYAVFDITQLEKAIQSERLVSFSFDLKSRSIHWIEFNLTIPESLVLPDTPAKTPARKRNKNRSR